MMLDDPLGLLDLLQLDQSEGYSKPDHNATLVELMCSLGLTLNSFICFEIPKSTSRTLLLLSNRYLLETNLDS